MVRVELGHLDCLENQWSNTAAAWQMSEPLQQKVDGVDESGSLIVKIGDCSLQIRQLHSSNVCSQRAKNMLPPPRLEEPVQVAAQ